MKDYEEDVVLRGIKPLDLCLLYKNFAWEKKNYLAVSTLLGFPLGGGDPLLETDFWKILGKELGKDVMLDEGMPKIHGELLVLGNFYAPGGEPVPSGAVRVKLGNIDKSILVNGNRYWETGGPSRPFPVAQMPIQYAYAFGGEGFDRNPSGKGFKSVQTPDGTELHPLPNLEDPKHPVTSKSVRPDPAGFGPIDLTWQPRAGKTGTYDEKWQREYAPGLAPDLDWSFFNTAPRDQWLDGYFQGGEAFVIQNMHPSKPMIKGTIPRFRARAFIHQRTSEGLTMREVENRLETVYFIPHADMGILLWRGAIEISTDDGTDIKDIMIAYENLADTPRTFEHYHDQLIKRTDPDEKLRYLLTTTDLIPVGIRCGFARLVEDAAKEGPQNEMLKIMDAKRQKMLDDGMQQMKAKLEEGKQMAVAEQEKINAQLAMVLVAQNMDPAPYMVRIPEEKFAIPEPPPDPMFEKLMDYLETVLPGFKAGNIDISKIDMKGLQDLKPQIEEYTNYKKAESIAQVQTAVESMKQDLNFAPPEDMPDNPEAKAAFEKLAQEKVAMFEQIDGILRKFDEPQPLVRAPGKETVEQIRQQLQDAREQMDTVKKDVTEQLSFAPDDVRQSTLEKMDVQIPSDLEDKLAPLEKMLEEFPEKFKGAYILGAHYMDTGTPPHTVPVTEVGAMMLAGYNSKKSLANGDYAAIRLPGQDLKGIDLSGSFLEDVDFSGCDLTGANLSGTILARANLSGAKLIGANLEGSNVGAAFLMDADLTDANLTNVILSRSNLNGARFLRAKLIGAQMLETKMERVDFSETEFFQTIFLDLNINDCKWNNAKIPKCMFIRVSMRKSDFTGATATECIWLEADLDESVFNEANMSNARFVGSSTLKKGKFIKTNLERANLMQTDLEEADFTGANLTMAYLERANLKNANLQGAQAIRACFMKANLEQANLRGVNLMEGSLMKAYLVRTILREANLFGCELMGITHGKTDFTDANLDRTILKNWHP
ncbi:MAG: DUF2169 domain-containing protein [SAR324 cluster bacterium]|nr:DUF2169 domain-containing protein [SAR324 cluster bacterium]